MKTRFKSSLLCLLAVGGLFFSSCERGGDTEKPVIRLIEPAEGAHLKIGDDHGVHFELELTDNVMLRSYKVEIHPNFDGHSHGAPMRAGTVDFRFNRSWDVSGRRNVSVHHHEIVVPENATPGEYHLLVYCTDAAGNEGYLARGVVLE
jgi:hypothetical protein